ncbi:hypothetical protein [Carnobacterium divergens]|uniref:hypothetical protein n=1 Tax=Carnobacterium divergens TaxID=2748 RepID=UPI0039C9817A
MLDKIKFSIIFIVLAVLINVGKFKAQFTSYHEVAFIFKHLFTLFVAGSVIILVISLFIYFNSAWGQWEKDNMKWYSVTSIVVLVICIVEKSIEFVII